MLPAALLTVISLVVKVPFDSDVFIIYLGYRTSLTFVVAIEMSDITPATFLPLSIFILVPVATKVSDITPVPSSTLLAVSLTPDICEKPRALFNGFAVTLIVADKV